jgi:hypothetical protein
MEVGVRLNSSINQFRYDIKITFLHHILFVCLFILHEICLTLIWFMVLKATCNNISVISWRSFLMVEEAGVLGGKPPTYRKSMARSRTAQRVSSCRIEHDIAMEVGVRL